MVKKHGFLKEQSVVRFVISKSPFAPFALSAPSA